VILKWRIDRKSVLLYRLFMITFCESTVKCKLRIMAMSVSGSLRFLSDASVSFYQYCIDENKLMNSFRWLN
jgi:hypothetical protein